MEKNKTIPTDNQVLNYILLQQEALIDRIMDIQITVLENQNMLLKIREVKIDLNNLKFEKPTLLEFTD